MKTRNYCAEHEDGTLGCEKQPRVNHTPTPWREYSRDILAGDEIIAVMAKGESDASQAQVDAEFIVRAVNNHDDLLAYAKRRLAFIEDNEPDNVDERAELETLIEKAEGK